MSYIDIIENRVNSRDLIVREPEIVKQHKKRYLGAESNRLVQDWFTSNNTADRELLYSLDTLRNRVRDLERENPLIRKFLRLVEINMIGRDGFTLKNMAQDYNGVLDTVANTVIENLWWAWGQKGQCTVDKTYSWIGLQRQVIRAVARDGEIFIRRYPFFDNKQGYALQLLKGDYVPTNLNMQLRNGNVISLGIEYNTYGQPVAYYTYRHDPGNSPVYDASTASDLVRIPSDQIIHIFYKERPDQGRGIPWSASIIFNLSQLAGFTEAELVAARMAACQMLIIQSSAPQEPSEEEDATPVLPTVNMAAGSTQYVPKDTTVTQVTPQHPNTQYGAFVKDIKRDMSGGLGVQYNSLDSNLEGVNYSSLRQGALEDRDNWKMLHKWFEEDFINPTFTDWLYTQFLNQNVIIYNKKGEARPLPITLYNKMNSPKWFGRSYSWVNPQQEAVANATLLDNMLTSHTKLLSENGVDFEELCQERAREKELIKKYGLEESDVIKKPVSVPVRSKGDN